MRATGETYIVIVTVGVVIIWLLLERGYSPGAVDEFSTKIGNFTVLKPKNKHGMSMECIRTNTKPPFTMCPVPASRSYVSHLYRKHLLWQSGVTRSMTKALNNYPTATVIDVGIHDGYHTMLAATKGHQVLAVEPNKHVASFVRRSLFLDNPKGLVTLLHHSLSDRGIVTLSAPKYSSFTKVRRTDVTAIHLDDVIPLINSKQAILKLDVDGRECKAWKKSHKFFTSMSVPYIFMSWHKIVTDMKKKNSVCNAKAFHQMTKQFDQLGYTAYDVDKLNNPANVNRPIHFVVFMHKSALRL